MEEPNSESVSKILECLDQLTDILRAAGKCSLQDVPRKVSLAKRELAQLCLEARGSAPPEQASQIAALETKHQKLRDNLHAVLDAD